MGLISTVIIFGAGVAIGAMVHNAYQAGQPSTSELSMTELETLYDKFTKDATSIGKSFMDYVKNNTTQTVTN